MTKTRERYLVTDPWKIIEEGFHPEKSRVSESLFSVANEYMGVRGYFEEGYSGDTLPGCYLNGVFEEHRLKEPLAHKGISRRIRFMVNTIDWLHTRLEIDGEVLDLGRSRFTGFRRELDFSTGALRRELVWRTGSGKKVRLEFTRLLGMRMKELALQRISLTPVNFSGVISVTMGLDFSPVHESYAQSFWECPIKRSGEDVCAVLGKSRNIGQKIFVGFSPPSAAAGIEYLQADRFVGCRVPLHLVEAREDTLERTCILFTSADPRAGEEETWAGGMELLTAVRGTTYEGVLKENGEHWKKIWRSADIVIDGDDEAQQGIRFCIFQLQQTCRGAMGSTSIGAKGLTGEAYNGHTFWDTETYCLPYYLFTNPPAAKAMIEFRHKTLPQALERARELDCLGACYPVATIDGTESCTLWQHASLQLQPTTAVAYAVRHYVTVTGDRRFLYEKGVELLIPICRFLASRGQWSPRSGGFGFYSVMGPDEFHMMVNNNCYTNYMAKETFEYTLQALAEMRSADPGRVAALLERLACAPEELCAWRKMSDSMIIPRDHGTGIFEQHEGFFDLPHIDMDAIPVEEFPLYAHWSYDRIFRGDMIKQPDVLMFLLLYNRSFGKDEKKANYDYYGPRCIHESSLSPSVHSILASELGLHRDAFELFGFATRIDLDNYNRNTAEGLHMTSIAAAWMNIAYGFGGLRSDGETLALDPTIPKRWKSYRFQITYRGSVIRLDVNHERARVRVLEGPPFSIVIRGNTMRLDGEGLIVSMEAACSPTT